MQDISFKNVNKRDHYPQVSLIIKETLFFCQNILTRLIDVNFLCRCANLSQHVNRWRTIRIHIRNDMIINEV